MLVFFKLYLMRFHEYDYSFFQFFNYETSKLSYSMKDGN